MRSVIGNWSYSVVSFGLQALNGTDVVLLFLTTEPPPLLPLLDLLTGGQFRRIIATIGRSEAGVNKASSLEFTVYSLCGCQLDPIVVEPGNSLFAT